MRREKKNTVYFSAILPKRHPEFFEALTTVLSQNRVSWELLPYTKDIWCRDYMPVFRPAGVERQFAGVEDSFVLFKYSPSYLQTKKWRSTITNAVKTCQSIGIDQRPFDLVVDGGNIVRFEWKAIMTEQVYRENPEESSVRGIMKDVLNVEELIMIPVEPGDPYGHADGCVRFIDNDRVLVNKPQRGQLIFARRLRKVLTSRGLRIEELPYFIECDPKNKDSAVGNYLNYLETEHLIVAPAYQDYPKYNRNALNTLERVFAGRKKVVQVESSSLAKEGGVLNCVSWNVWVGPVATGRCRSSRL